MSLDVRPEVERMVRERAARQGVSVDDLLAQAFAGHPAPEAPEQRVRRLLTEWQASDAVITAVLSYANGHTPRASLLARWRESDTEMTDEEREAEDRLWEAVVQSIDETRAALGMRPLSG
jgi:hypothetical protein